MGAILDVYMLEFSFFRIYITLFGEKIENPIFFKECFGITPNNLLHQRIFDRLA